MSVQITINVPDETYHLAQQFASITGQAVEEIVANLIGYVLPLVPPVEPKRSAASLTDGELLAAAAITMTSEADHRHRDLLAKQNEGWLSSGEQAELQRLQQVYEIALLYKNQALIEAAKRGIWKPSHS